MENLTKEQVLALLKDGNNQVEFEEVYATGFLDLVITIPLREGGSRVADITLKVDLDSAVQTSS